MIDSNNNFKKLSKGLIESVRSIMEAKEGTTPKTEKEKDLAAKAPPHDKITHADVLAGRGVLKKHPTHGKMVVAKEEAGLSVARNVLHKMRAKNEEVDVDGEQIDEAMNAADRFQQHHTTAKDHLKSITQHLNAHADAAKNAKDYKGKKGPNWGHVGTMEHVAQQLGGIHDMLARQGEYAMNESVELDEAPVDGVAPGSMANDGHLCATKVFHKEWAEGTPLFSQHAEPDENGDIAWYDVMFEHGIERVMTEEVEVLMAETHERHGKRKMKEEVEDLEELSTDTLKSYAGKAGPDSYAQGGNPSMKKRFNRIDGVNKAYAKMQGNAKVNATEEVEHIDELSTDTLKSYRTKARAQGNKIIDNMKVGGGDWSKDQVNTKTLRKRAAGAQMSGKQLVKRGESLKTEEAKLDEARGRPRKNPLPAGQSDEPEPRQHIIQQLQRAKLSMQGGAKVKFKNGEEHQVHGAHAAKLLDKYAGMKPNEKETFQKKVGASHEGLKSEL